MFVKLGQFFNSLMRKFLPDAFVFAIILTFIVAVMAMVFTPHSGLEIIEFWGDGLWNLLKFSMEMALILITGFTLAKTNIVKRALDRAASFADNQTKAVLVATTISSLACYLNWGFGLIVAALISIELAKRVDKINFGLLIASSYSGFLLWHGGISGSIPLKLTSPSNKVQSILGVDSIGLSETIFTSFNLMILFGNFFVILAVNYFLSRDTSLSKVYDIQDEEIDCENVENKTIANKLENSRSLVILMSAMALIYMGIKFYKNQNINLGIITFFFFFLGMFLHGTFKKFLEVFNQSVNQASGIILQFPLYAGIMSIMSLSGLGALISQFFIDTSSDSTFLVFTYWSAGLLNFFVPSGGGQWALQAPIILPAAKELGLELNKAAMAIAWGDAWTNMVQPFWALPLLSVAKIKLKEMMGYSVIIFVASGLLTSLIFAII